MIEITSTGQSNMAGRATPESRRHRYTRDEDWQALAHAWRTSSSLRQLFDDAFTTYEMTARDEKRIRETSDGAERTAQTWRLLESLGIRIDAPPIGPNGRRAEPVHFTRREQINRYFGSQG